MIKEISESIKAFDIIIHDDLPEVFKPLAKSRSIALEPDEVYVEIQKIQTVDAYTARELAERRIDTLTDLFTLFNHKEKITWKAETFIRQCCLDDPVIITSPKNSMEKGFDLKPKQASKQLNDLISNFSLTGRSFEKFSRVVDFHGICVSNDVTENQLLGLWIAMETITPSHIGGSKIVNVIRAFMPFLLLNYVRRLIERLTADLLRWNRTKTKSILKKIDVTEGVNLKHRVLNLLINKNNSDILDELYGALSDYPLLRFRLFQIHEHLSSAESIKKLLETHENKVAWQLRRIYRTRNLIVHSGRRPPYIHTLIENAHDYIDQILFDVVKLSCGEYKAESIEQAFELTRIKYQSYRKKLEDIEDFDNNNCLFLIYGA